METLKQTEDRPINLEESSSTELKRVVVSDDDSPSTRTPEMPRKPHPATDRRELLHQEFASERIV